MLPFEPAAGAGEREMAFGEAQPAGRPRFVTMVVRLRAGMRLVATHMFGVGRGETLAGRADDRQIDGFAEAGGQGRRACLVYVRRFPARRTRPDRRSSVRGPRSR
ncbi:hypothetical protein AB0C47_15970 [Micromonospora taraxaci]|uniref:hypothetical protein n=1 Tax=Micromonospora taraxaci TaxID=1316803 RepID=UPI0033E47B6A